MPEARLIVEGQSTPAFEHPGAQNMAIDEALLHSAHKEQLTTLRFYSWKPATLSLGYFQKFADRSCHPPSQSCDIVRRASGGGAILHDRELTYCFATPTKDRFGDAEEYYLAFHETLVELLAEQGVTAELHNADHGLSNNAFLCFQRRASNDVTCDGHKIAGSAQRRWKRGLVQHGSLLLEQSRYAPELPGLRNLTSLQMSTELLIHTWTEKLGSRLNLEFKPTRMTDNETRQMDQWTKEKFLCAEWTEKR